jgi:hypothetical protein
MIPTPVDPQESDDDLELEQVQFRLKTCPVCCMLSAVCEEEEEEDFGTSSIPMWHQSRATKRSGGSGWNSRQKSENCSLKKRKRRRKRKRRKRKQHLDLERNRF